MQKPKEKQIMMTLEPTSSQATTIIIIII